jgi:hypothetical protein
MASRVIQLPVECDIESSAVYENGMTEEMVVYKPQTLLSLVDEEAQRVWFLGLTSKANKKLRIELQRSSLPVEDVTTVIILDSFSVNLNVDQ